MGRLRQWLGLAGEVRAQGARLAAESEARVALEQALAQQRRDALSREAALLQQVAALEARGRAQAAALHALTAEAVVDRARASAGGLSAAERSALARLAASAPAFPSLPRAGAEPAEAWFYSAFEQMFRGTRGEIAARLAVHLDTARDAWQRTGGKPLIDLGCGRGEWLELARDHGMHAIGIDQNPGVVASCRALGLDAHRADAVSHLQAVESDGVSVVTAFHVVEHLPVNAIVALLVHVERVLAPGGVVILETPNPDNLVVGANTFWLDPSHLRPLPSRLLRFCVESSGLVVERVQPLGEDAALLSRAAQEGWPAGLAEALGGARDYAIVARKGAP